MYVCVVSVGMNIQMLKKKMTAASGFYFLTCDLLYFV